MFLCSELFERGIGVRRIAWIVGPTDLCNGCTKRALGYLLKLRTEKKREGLTIGLGPLNTKEIPGKYTKKPHLQQIFLGSGSFARGFKERFCKKRRGSTLGRNSK